MSAPGRTGMLVAVEGIDGAGKSWVTGRLARHLELNGHRVERVARYLVPELTQLWHRVVSLDIVDQRAAALLAAADYAVGVEPRIRRPLADGRVVLSDRYIYSHVAYFRARGLPVPELLALFSVAVEPDLILYLDVTPERALKRLRSAGKPDLWECGLDYRLGFSIATAVRAWREGAVPREAQETHFVSHQRQMLEAFRSVLPQERTAIVNAEDSPDEVFAACRDRLDRLLVGPRPSSGEGGPA